MRACARDGLGAYLVVDVSPCLAFDGVLAFTRVRVSDEVCSRVLAWCPAIV
jgi:hypothetical protein